MSDINLLQTHYSNLVREVDTLIDACLALEAQFIGHSVSARTKPSEDDFLNSQQEKVSAQQPINVEVLGEWQHRAICLSAWKEFKTQPHQDTKYVARWPGLVAVQDNHQQIRDRITYINQAKDDIAHFVQQPLPAEEAKKLNRKHRRTTQQKHEFIHTALPRVMTEQLYRHIHIIEEHVTHAWFNWVSRPVPRTYNQLEAENLVESAIDDAIDRDSDSIYIDQLEATLVEIKKDKYFYFQVRKQSQPLPTLVYQTRELVGDEWVAKRYTRNANIPFVLMGQPNGQLPKVSHLAPYNPLTKRTTKKRPLKNKELLNATLNLYGSTQPLPEKYSKSKSEEVA